MSRIVTAFNYDRFAERIEVGPNQSEAPALPTVIPAVPLAEQLSAVSSKSISKLDEILDIPLDPQSEQFATILRAQTSASNTALTTQAKVDENRFRERKNDTLAKLLDRMNDEELKLNRTVHGEIKNL